MAPAGQLEPIIQKENMMKTMKKSIVGKTTYKKDRSQQPKLQSLYWRETSMAVLGSVADLKDRGVSLTVAVPPEVQALCRHLLTIGGKTVVVPFDVNLTFIKDLVPLGKCFSTDGLTLVKGEDSSCVKNSARLWSQDKNKSLIVMGFALSDDQMWRFHAWVLTQEARIIETTIIRTMYYGIVQRRCSCEIITELSAG